MKGDLTLLHSSLLLKSGAFILAANKKEILQAYLQDVVGSVPDHCNRAGITRKRVTQNIWFPSAHKN